MHRHKINPQCSQRFRLDGSKGCVEDIEQDNHVCQRTWYHGFLVERLVHMSYKVGIALFSFLQSY